MQPVLRSLIDLVAPPTCARCGLPGGPVCAACLASVAGLPQPTCARCGHPLPVAVPRCRHCRPSLAWARQAAPYAGPAGELVVAMKDGGRRDLAPMLARLVALRCPGPPPDVVLVPVPLAAPRLAERGYNQAVLLAARLAACWGVAWSAEPLQRVRDAPPQRGASRTIRSRQVSGAFAVPARARVPSRVWLVDDVFTTGATLGACALALRRGGAREVGAVTVARALLGGDGG